MARRMRIVSDEQQLLLVGNTKAIGRQMRSPD